VFGSSIESRSGSVGRVGARANSFLLGPAAGLSGAGFNGELFLGLSRILHREGLLWMPRGGVDDTASGTTGGSSGSGCGGMLTPVVGDRRSVCPMNGFSSSSPSGAGGGSGLGFGFAGDLRGAAAKPPLVLLTERPELGPTSLRRVASSSTGGSLARISSAFTSASFCARKSSEMLCSLASLPRRAAGRALVLGPAVAVGFAGEADRRRSSICGL